MAPVAPQERFLGPTCELARVPSTLIRRPNTVLTAVQVGPITVSRWPPEPQTRRQVLVVGVALRTDIPVTPCTAPKPRPRNEGTGDIRNEERNPDPTDTGHGGSYIFIYNSYGTEDIILCRVYILTACLL